MLESQGGIRFAICTDISMPITQTARIPSESRVCKGSTLHAWQSLVESLLVQTAQLFAHRMLHPLHCCTPCIADATPSQIEDVTSFHTMTDLWPSRESFGSRLALRPCSPLLSDAGTLQRARSHGGFVRPKFSKTSPDFGFPSAASASVMLREKTPTAGVLSENTRAEYRAAELERVLKEDFAFQNKAHNLKTGFPEMDSYKDSLESGLREEQFRQDHRRTSCSCFHL